MVFRGLGTSCNVHVLVETSVLLRLWTQDARSGGSEADCSVSSDSDEKCSGSHPDEPGTLRSLSPPMVLQWHCFTENAQ